jgi:hypothetical protein
MEEFYEQQASFWLSLLILLSFFLGILIDQLYVSSGKPIIQPLNSAKSQPSIEGKVLWPWNLKGVTGAVAVLYFYLKYFILQAVSLVAHPPIHVPSSIFIAYREGLPSWYRMTGAL